MSKVLLVDGDMVAYRCAASCEPTKTKLEREPLDEAIFRANDLLYRIVDTCASNQFRVFISGSRNFRKQLYPDYKAHRASQPRPAHLDAIRELLVREWEAEICDGYEADDGIGMAHDEHSIIVSNDKDFRQIPGEIFNPVKNGGEFEVVDSIEASRSFYVQLLQGDAADNVPGVAGIGPVRAARILADCTPEEMHSKVFELYNNPERFFLNYRLLRILRSRDEWDDVERELNEAPVSEEQGQEPTEVSSTEDSTNLSGIN